MYLIRLDDAAEYMDTKKWDRMLILLCKYSIIPIIGVIPKVRDESLISEYKKNTEFFDRLVEWQNKGFTIAMHGYEHVYSTNNGGINPVNKISEFAGLSLDEQREKIRSGIKILKRNNIHSSMFFAPAHTFDENTLESLRLESDIRIISDTIADDIYKKGDFYFIPQQSGNVRNLPFKVTTFCYHPNTMNELDFKKLEEFFIKYKSKFGTFEELSFHERNLSLYDRLLQKIYFAIKKIRNKLR